jgi:hypothetical protein
MAGREPIAETAAEIGFEASGPLTPWASAKERLAQARNYWLTTVRPEGRPHVVPVWGVWLDNVFYFSTGDKSRKARNLELEPRCAFSVEAGNLHLVVEGSAARVNDEALLRRMAEAYTAKYDWPLEVRDGGVYGDGGGGPAYAVIPKVAFAFDAGDVFSATRFRFG